MSHGRAILAALLVLSGTGAQALTLPGGAVEIARRSQGVTRVDLPVAPFDQGAVPTVAVEGQMIRTAYALRGRIATPDQIAAELRPQLETDGWQVAFECAAARCGGYDFRFATNTLPAPDMYVDLGEYRYLLARHADGGALSIMVSRARDTGYVQVTEVLPAGQERPAIVSSSKSDGAGATAAGDVIDRLLRDGRAPLDDLLFGTGSATLEGESFASLGDVAAWLGDNPARRLAIVGHTDSAGGLAANIALSERRAAAVRQALVGRYGADPARLEARGVGYLSPRDSNASEAGRLANRRVEVVLTD